MASLRESVPESTSPPVLRAAGDQQYGRSSSSLYAERAAASLQRPGSLTPDESVPILSAARDTNSDGPSSSPAPQTYTPQYSKPGLLASIDHYRDSDDSAPSSNQPQTASLDSSTHSHSPRVPSRKRLQKRKILQRPGNGSVRTGTPQGIWELGIDYTRYYNPFSDSRGGSPIGDRALLPRYSLPSMNPSTTPQVSTQKTKINCENEGGEALINDRLGAPYSEKGVWSWPLFHDDPEPDDALHMPTPDDDVDFRTNWKVYFTPHTLVSSLGALVMMAGLLFVFVVLPILSYMGVIEYNSQHTPLSEMWVPAPPQETTWATVNNRTDYPLLQNIRRGLIDPATPKSALKKQGINGDDMVLVFSDEFNQNNRTFYEGDDPYWYAPDFWYGATQDMEWYDPDAVTTWDGTLELRLDKAMNHQLLYRSGMLHSWNHLCFKGGIFEVSVSLPGPAAVAGLWPGAWTMGNLGRPGYLSTTDGLWPYTYNSCDVGITPNQSSYDGLSHLGGQRLPSCTCPGEDHPTPGTGRGAPEIDIFEAGASYGGLPIVTQSYQVAPFDVWYYPDYNFTMFPDYSISYPNGYVGGPFQQALSATTNLNKNWFDGKAYQTYHFEYVPGEGEDAYIAWFVGDQLTFKLDGRAIGPNGNIAARQISEEPMSMVLNLGISNSWTWINWEKLKFPTVMRVDYVRLYQKEGHESVTCDPPGYETTEYIKQHMDAYTNPNFTNWEQTGYPLPLHKLNTDC